MFSEQSHLEEFIANLNIPIFIEKAEDKYLSVSDYVTLNSQIEKNVVGVVEKGNIFCHNYCIFYN